MFSLTFPPALGDSHHTIKKLLSKVGGPVSSIEPKDVILATVAGSAMYNLATKGSDVDYLIVYKTPTEVVKIYISCFILVICK